MSVAQRLALLFALAMSASFLVAGEEPTGETPEPVVPEAVMPQAGCVVIGPWGIAIPDYWA